MVQVDQHPALAVWLVKGVIGVCAAWLALFFFIGGLAADMDNGVILAWAQINHICAKGMSKRREQKLTLFLQLSSENMFRFLQTTKAKFLLSFTHTTYHNITSPPYMTFTSQIHLTFSVFTVRVLIITRPLPRTHLMSQQWFSDFLICFKFFQPHLLKNRQFFRKTLDNFLEKTLNLESLQTFLNSEKGFELLLIKTL